MLALRFLSWWLFVVCSPTVSPLPQASIEAHAGAACAERAGQSALVMSDGRLSTLNQTIMTRRPRVVVFIGHGDVHSSTSERTLGLTDESGNLVRMQPDTIVDVLGGASDRLELLVLNGCKTESLCQAVSRKYRIPSCGWRTRTADLAAKVWSIALVESLVVRGSRPLSRSDVCAAYEQVPTAGGTWVPDPQVDSSGICYSDCGCGDGFCDRDGYVANDEQSRCVACGAVLPNSKKRTEKPMI